jgi:hypothetical protein
MEDEEMEEYECVHCEGMVKIIIIKDTDKATEPSIEFCPFCAMSNSYPIEMADGD